MTEAIKSRTVNSEPQDPITERCIVQFYDPLFFPWETISDAVMAMERYNFPKHPEPVEKLRGIFADPKSSIGVVLDPDAENPLVGFSVILPAETEYSFPDWQFPERLTEPAIDLSKAAYVHVTQLAGDHQGHKLVTKLNPMMMQWLLTTEYDYLERDAATENDYAAKLVAAYEDQIIKQFIHPSKFGEQMFLRQHLRPLRSGLERTSIPVLS